MSIDKEIVEDFVVESKGIIDSLLELLEGLEGDFSQVKRLSEYGNGVDRIMGGAKSLSMLSTEADHPLHMISDYAALCKAVGYKASQIKDNEQFYDICVALLLDATETLSTLINNIDRDGQVLRQTIPQAFIERLRWVSNQFSADYAMSVGSERAPSQQEEKKLGQVDIDELLKKLGL